jgi:hypothetical protein
VHGLRSGGTGQEDADEGVAIPSLSPLSTLSTRRMRAGTRWSCTIGAPSAASVGATAAAITAATQSPVPR